MLGDHWSTHSTVMVNNEKKGGLAVIKTFFFFKSELSTLPRTCDNAQELGEKK